MPDRGYRPPIADGELECRVAAIDAIVRVGPPATTRRNSRRKSKWASSRTVQGCEEIPNPFRGR